MGVRGPLTQFRSEHYLRVRYEHFEPFAACFAFDDDGVVLDVADTATMRHHIEDHIRSEATA